MAPALAALLFQLASRWRDQPTGTGADLYAVSAVSADVCYASGAKGTWARTVDGGHTWYSHVAPGAAKLDFRCLFARDANHAFFLNTGSPARLYRTTNGVSAAVVYENQTDGISFFGLAFWDERTGLMVANPIAGGGFLVVMSTDGGATWRETAASMLTPLPGERGLASTGSSLVVKGRASAWFATGGAATPRVFQTTDAGRSWSVSNVPLPSSPTGGIRALAFWDESRGLAIASDSRKPDDAAPDVARTTDGGRTWSLAGRTRPIGMKESLALVPGTAGPSCVAAGPSGTSFSTDFGKTWRWLDRAAFHAVSFAGPANAGWGVGDGGRIAKLRTGVVAGTGTTAKQEKGKVIGQR
jgi:photosystem II stability/assembly factor-like uncharacterized protein